MKTIQHTGVFCPASQCFSMNGFYCWSGIVYGGEVFFRAWGMNWYHCRRDEGTQEFSKCFLNQ